jgi:DNA invertase Pin-like site-specific DNA recombinase
LLDELTFPVYVFFEPPFKERVHVLRVVAYYRVSTKRQGASGLGLDAQRTAVTAFLRGVAPVAEFTEVESGRKTDGERPELASAIEACRLYRARLVVAKLDRLARNAYFLHKLKASGIEFLCCDMPDANHLTISILAAVAEDEARCISERTKAALAARKASGKPLGNSYNLKRQSEGRRLGTLARQTRAQVRALEVVPVIDALQVNGKSLRAIARELTRLGIPTARGGRWTASRVKAMRQSAGERLKNRCKS